MLGYPSTALSLPVQFNIPPASGLAHACFDAESSDLQRAY